MTYDNISSQYQNYRRIALIVVHCSATRADRSFPVEALRRCHVQERGFADIGYHFYITRDGVTHVCRPIDHIGAHARCFNDHSIGASKMHTGTISFASRIFISSMVCALATNPMQQKRMNNKLFFILY